MRKQTFFILPFMAVMASTLIFAAVGSAAAQNANMGGNMSVGTNMTSATMGGNMTSGNATSNTSGSSAKMHLEEGIKALQSGDKQGAMTHLDAAQQAMSGASSEAIKHFEEGMKALSGGDIKGAIMHLQFADQALG